jgi:hypothetical protein
MVSKPWEEAGESSVHRVTAQVAKIGENNLPKNLHRDLFRFIRLPVDLVYVSCPMLMEPWLNDRIHEVKLPMIDPHERLEYLNRSGRLDVPMDEIAMLVTHFVYILWFDSANVPKQHVHATPGVFVYSLSTGDIGATGARVQNGWLTIQVMEVFHWQCMGTKPNSMILVINF